MIIKIKNFKFKTILGIYKWEEEFEREVIINLAIHTDHDRARFTNNINDTIDYDKITDKIKTLLLNKNFRLIEEMSQQILDLIMQDDRIKRCEIEVDKVGVIDGVESFAVLLSQNRE